MLAARWRGDRALLRRLGGAVALAIVLAASLAHAADYAREERWAREVVPSLVVGDAVWLVTPTRPKVLAILAEPSGAAKGAVVVIHGLGVHPDFGVAGALRSRLADAGFTTLSVQMPVLAADATREAYPPTFVEAGERIGAAIAWLRARGATRVAIVSHSVGASMADAYLARPDAAKVDAWAPVGMLVAFTVAPREPVLDAIAANELPEVRAAAPGRAAQLPKDGCSRQLTIAGADHYFDPGTAPLADAIAAFLARAFAGGC